MLKVNKIKIFWKAVVVIVMLDALRTTSILYENHGDTYGSG